MEAGKELIGTGRTADVYALSQTRVLRRYRIALDVAAEAAAMQHVAAHGYPAPAVHDATGQDLVMERVHGPTMLAAVLAGDTTAQAVAEILANLHNRLRQVPVPDMIDEESVLHLDLHPDNVILDHNRGPVLIDWHNTSHGPGGLDVAVTALILAEVAVLPRDDIPDAVRKMIPAMLRVFLEGVDHVPAEHLDAARRYRRSNPTLSTPELRAVDHAAELVAPMLV